MAQLTLQKISVHLTQAVVQRAFHLKIGKEDTIQSLELSPAAPPGSGLIGALYRIKVKGKNNSTSFIAKTLVRDPLLRKSLPSEIFFQREIFFYLELLPALVKVQKSSGAKEMIQNVVPICYACHCDGISDYILLEDISYSAASIHPTACERNKILKTLAHLHAVSMGMRIKEPEEFVKLKNSLSELYYTENRRQFYANYLKKALELDLEALKKVEDPSRSIYYKKFFEIVSNDPYGQLVDLLCSSDHMVFNHGDAWSPNFLCSKEKAIAIDFQLARCTSPVADLSYFLLLSINSCPTKDKFIEVVRLYYDYFVHYLKDMGVDDGVFTWDDLNSDLKKHGKFGLLTASTSIPLLGSERCNVLESFEEKYAGMETIPLEILWPLSPLSTVHQITNLKNAVHVMVDLELI